MFVILSVYMATLKQKLAVKEILDNNGNVSQAMIKAGYPPTTAKNPQQLTRSKGFKELMEQMGISDEKIAKRLDEGLDATKTIVMGTKSEESFVDIQPDFAIRHKYIETALKLKGHLESSPFSGLNVNFINNVPRPNSRTRLQSKSKTD